MTRFFSYIFALMLLVLPQAVLAAYTIAPGDTLQIEVVEDSSLNRNVLVLPDGTINFPGAGTLRVAGKSVDSVRASLTSSLAPQFASTPSIYVSVAQLASPDEKLRNASQVFVMGEVNQPGLLKVDHGLTILQAIAQAGGFSRFAATKRVELHRMDPSNQTEHVFIFNYRKGGGISGATRLQEGDVIVVPERHLFE